MPYKDLEERKRCHAISRQKRIAKQRQEILVLLGNKCVRCSFDDDRALAIDHKNGGGSKEREQVGGGYYTFILNKIKSGSNEYQVLCCNCNQIKRIENKEDVHKKHIE